MKIFKILMALLTITLLSVSMEACSKKSDPAKKKTEKPKKAEDTPIDGPSTLPTTEPKVRPSFDPENFIDPLGLDGATPSTLPSSEITITGPSSGPADSGVVITSPSTTPSNAPLPAPNNAM